MGVAGYETDLFQVIKSLNNNLNSRGFGAWMAGTVSRMAATSIVNDIDHRKTSLSGEYRCTLEGSMVHYNM